MDYLARMKMLAKKACDGIHEYAFLLEDLSTLVYDPISNMINLTEDAPDFPESLAERNEVIRLLSDAAHGADHYAATREDTTDCTHYIDEVLEILGLLDED